MKRKTKAEWAMYNQKELFIKELSSSSSVAKPGGSLVAWNMEWDHSSDIAL